VHLLGKESFHLVVFASFPREFHGNLFEWTKYSHFAWQTCWSWISQREAAPLLALTEVLIFDNLPVSFPIVAKLGFISKDLIILPIFLVEHPFDFLLLRNAHKGLQSVVCVLWLIMVTLVWFCSLGRRRCGFLLGLNLFYASRNCLDWKLCPLFIFVMAVDFTEVFFLEVLPSFHIMRRVIKALWQDKSIVHV